MSLVKSARLFVTKNQILHESCFSKAKFFQDHTHSTVKTVIKRGIRTRGSPKERKGLAPVEELKVPSENIGQTPRRYSSLAKPFLFTLAVGTSSFGAAAIWQYEELRKHARHSIEAAASYTGTVTGKVGQIRQQMHVWWQSKSKGERLMVGVYAVNGVVFLLWKFPALLPGMLKWFTSSPFGGAPCWSMMLSTFSHYSFLHLFVNMYVLSSFTPGIMLLFGKEQFVGFYLTAGVFSGFTGYIHKVLIGSMRPSVGASGAIMAMIGAVCSHFPESRLSIAFVDKFIPHSFSADKAVKGLILFDCLGLLLRWKLFDHAAHLGGMLFGLWYVHYGHKMIWGNREGIMKLWHQIRSKGT